MQMNIKNIDLLTWLNRFKYSNLFDKFSLNALCDSREHPILWKMQDKKIELNLKVSF